MKQIFEEIRLNRLTLKNRLVRSATWEGIADEAGHLNGALFAIYEELFRGGAGAEIAGRIRAACPNLHISMKVNSDDFTAGGLDNAESLALCKILAPHLDSIEVSGNGTSVGGIRAGVNEAYFAPFASRLAREVKTPVICVGGFRSRAAMKAVLNKSDIALISLFFPPPPRVRA